MEYACSECGAINSENAVFCTTCGAMPLQDTANAPIITIPEQPAIISPVQAKHFSDSGIMEHYQSPPYLDPPVKTYGYFDAERFSQRSSIMQKAGLFERWLAWIIDTFLIFLISFLSLIPILGGILVAITATGYLLLRDQNGASIGKRVMKLQVVNNDGRPANRNALIIRNALFAFPYLLHFIPYLGILFTLLIWTPICLVESLSVLFTGHRISDKIAGTIVVKRHI